jgi:acyl-CoA thioester hydrolase
MTVFRNNQRVVYSQCTVGNHVYYARYLDILEAARGEFFRDLGSSCLQLQEAGTIFPVVGLELSYKAPARYDDLLTIELWIAELHGIRLTFGCRILNQNGVLLVEGETRHVCTTEAEKPKRLPPGLAECLKPFLREA